VKIFWKLLLHLVLLWIIIETEKESFLFMSLMMIAAIIKDGIRSPRIKIAMVTRWWSVGERSSVNSETIALVIGHGRPMRKRDPPRTFVSRIFCPPSCPFFCLFPSSPSCVPFRALLLPPQNEMLPSFALETYLEKIDRERRSLLPRHHFHLRISSRAVPD